MGTWASIAGSEKNAGSIVLCADSDHTIFPGFFDVVSRCISQHDFCIQANFISAGTAEEAGELAHDVAPGRPHAEFWNYAFVNTGMFAMRCGPALAAFWTAVAGLMRWGFANHGAANDQDAAMVMLRDFRSDLSWGIFDPYAVNQLSEQSLRSKRWPGPHVRRLLDGMRAHHAVYTSPECALEQIEVCKLALMRLANESW